ncbi:SHOCT domain-containing protein [Candidatus Saccharibacteria bacterium]|nr:MAG: SHOCT domain-containing protein [Candidatus Saccharibacteria bacterium]
MPGLLRGMARTAVIAGTATAVSNGVSRRQYNRWESQAEQQQAQAQAAAPQQAAAPSTDDQMAQLQQLGQLHEQGILTDEEFTAKKQQILGL